MGMMNLFNKKKKLLELQNLIFNNNSTKLYYSEESLLSLASQRSQEIIDSTNQIFQKVNTTALPSAFFDGYDKAKENVRTLIKFEPYVDFSSGTPSKEFIKIIDTENKQIQLLITRVLNKACERIVNNQITDKEKAYDDFFKSFKGYYSRLQPSHMDYIKQNAKNRIYYVVEEQIKKQDNNSNSIESSNVIGTDSMMDEAIRIVIEAGQASTALLQRRLKVGYVRANRMIDDMELMGIVGPYLGLQTRDVLITYNEWLERKGLLLESSDNLMTSETDKHKSQFEGISEKTIIKEDEIIKSKTGIIADYSDDGYFVERLDNYIIPKSDEKTQIQFIDNVIKNASSKKVQLLLLDDGLAFSKYKGIPHLFIPIVTENAKGIGALNWLCSELYSRQRTLSEYGCRTITSFNELIDKNITYMNNQKDINSSDSENTSSLIYNGLKVPTEKMVHIVLVKSEFYNLKSFSEVDEALIPLLLNGKQFGIHLYLFSKLSVKSLSLGVKEDLLRIGDSDDLQEIFLKGPVDVRRSISMDEIDNSMNGYQFETLCGELLQKKGFTKIKVTQSSADYGADVIAYKEGVKYAIQCKKYSNPVGISAIQEVIASKSMYDCHVAVVLTNNTFTKSAINLAEKNGVLLWDREVLSDLLKLAKTE